MATKEDLVNLENRLAEKISASEKSLRSDFEKFEMKIIIKVGSMIFLLGGFLAAIKFWI